MASREPPPIRVGTPDDVDALLDFWRESSHHTTVSDNPASLTLLLEHPTAWLLVAEADDRIAGTLLAAWDGWRGNLYRLAVRAELRRRGIASALLREAERRLFGVGARRITAMIERGDERATAFWTAAGYLLDAENARYLKEGP